MRPLDQQICFTLYATSMAITRAYKPTTWAQVPDWAKDADGHWALAYTGTIAFAVNKRLLKDVPRIAARLDLESSTVTPLVKRLEAAGLVERRRGAEDERRVEVSMTAAGRDLLERSMCLGDLLMERSGMTGAALEALNKQVQALREAVTAD